MNQQDQHIFDVIVVGAGPAGIGVGVALKDAEVENFVIVDRHEVGASLKRWPAETRFITPSFPTNSIGMLDLNSIAIGVSPAYSLEVEHPTGSEYASHLKAVAEHFELQIETGIDVQRVAKVDDVFLLDTPQDTLRCKNVIWAAGEFQYPNLGSFPGAELCRHTSTIRSYEDLDGDNFVIIGGYESGIDAAYHIAELGKTVRVIDQNCPWKDESSDPSVALSTFTRERTREEFFESQVELIADTEIEAVTRKDHEYEILLGDQSTLKTCTRPLLATGFAGSQKLIIDLFEKREDGYPVLNEHDESTITPGLFLCGPMVRHDNHVFCFIYKFRQRFAVVAKQVAKSLGLSGEGLEEYRKWGMYLDDLSCCGEECVC
ncbi:NAD(P)/FAD-dependent oxidoreductase [Thalassoglobus sp. JC818]|uniref:NAD(P)/FAD-dependent oxidoreductase n=1 Tax=Thalassoglobus sp. JC818 TaxID=3232136 RepID=UPI00345787E9